MATHTNPDELVGSAEVCRELEVNPSTVSRWAQTGALPVAHKLPGKNGALLFRRGDVDKWAAERNEKAATEQSEQSA